MTAANPVWTLLAVDDEPNILAALRRLFRPTGWRILTAGHAEEALALLAAEPVDAVLSDMRMPGMDGVQLLERVSQGWPRTARLLLTGQADLSSTIAAINRGRLHRYITKPWNDDELVLTLCQVAERQQLEADKQALERLTQQQNDELKALNSGLEARVALRTEELAAANDRLKRNYLTSIKAFTALIELRGSTQVGHARQVADLARRIAQAMVLDADAAHDLPIAALLHDIGHIGLSDAVLARPLSRLDSDELRRYRLHPVLGEQALLASDDMQGVAPLIRAHHERWDGQGFPDGLRGAAIPLGARILAVADAFEDLRCGRVDGQALRTLEARRALLAGRGSQFDPTVVDAFESLFSAAPAKPTVATLRLRTAELRAGQTLVQDFVSPEGVLLLSAGQRLNDDLIGRIRAFERKHGLALTLAVQLPLEASPVKRLLIVDDETPVLHALRRLLLRHFMPQQLGVEVCADPLRALQRLQEARFDVVISDYRMPRLDGVTLLARARALDPRTVRMMLSAAADFGTVLAAVNRAGIFRYIPKPWNEPQLLADLRAALEFDPCASLSAGELERRRLEALEPGITQVEWGPNGEVLMPGHLATRPGKL